jgi:hypothetical protein
MKVQEILNEGDVVKGNFGSGPKNDGIDIPKGYKSFKTEDSGPKSAKLIGVKADGTEKVISTGHKELIVALAKEYNSGGKGGTGLQPISMMQAFGSKAMNILHDAGIHFMEKPDYFETLEKNEGKYKPLNQVTFKKVEKELKKAGMELSTFTSKEIYGADPRGPQVSFKHKPKADICVIEFSNGKRYLVDTTQANTYIRMWILIA